MKKALALLGLVAALSLSIVGVAAASEECIDPNQPRVCRG